MIQENLFVRSFAYSLSLFYPPRQPQLPEEEDYDLSDVDLDYDDKDELWAQTGRDLIQIGLVESGLVWSCATRLPSPVDEWEARLPSYWNTPEKTH